MLVEGSTAHQREQRVEKTHTTTNSNNGNRLFAVKAFFVIVVLSKLAAAAYTQVRASSFAATSALCHLPSQGPKSPFINTASSHGATSLMPGRDHQGAAEIPSAL